MTTPGPVLALVALHLVAGMVAPLLTRRWGPAALRGLALVPAATFAWALSVAPSVLDGEVHRESFRWAPELGFELLVRVDAMSLLMVGVVSGVGVLVVAYAGSYLSRSGELGRLSGLLVAFAGCMVGLVTTDNLLALFLFWEGTSITSYLLIGIDDRSERARAAALRALLTTGGAGLAMLAGLVLLGQQTDTWTLSEILARPSEGTITTVAVMLVLVGALAKSAQFPFHFWLPGAMAAPTPVSAYLHSATMVKAGVYLIARLSPSFADVAPWRPVVVAAGLATLLIGAWRALAQTDLKLLLAHGTTSQLGFMVVLFGLGRPEATLAGAAVLLAHAAYKAALFMVVGIVDHETGTREITHLSGLHRQMRLVAGVAVVASASMAGLPPLIGFIAKESAFEALLHHDDDLWGLATVGLVVVGSALTVAYAARILWGAFADKDAADLEGPPAALRHRPGPGLVGPAVVLAAFTVAAGVAPVLVSDLLVGAATALDPSVDPHGLALWHGINTALLLSVLAIAVGLAMFAVRRRFARVQAALPHPPSGSRVFDLVLYRTVLVADEVTGRLQTGSLPFYLIVIITTVLAVPGVLLVSALEVPDGVMLYDRPMQLPVAVVMTLGALGAIASRHRLAAVICVGSVGYGVAVLFVIQGAPDLAITQLLIETLLLVVFVLVLRHLPRRFTGARTAIPRRYAAAASVLVGVFAATFTLVSVGSRPDIPSVSDDLVDLAVPEGGGENVVNVILVDFRAFDTMGEILVLTVAALGVVGLVRSAQRARVETHTSLPGRPFRRSPVLDVAVRALFRTLLLYSLVLLLVGHDVPGGGFIGGLVAGAALVLVYLAGGSQRLRRTEPFAPEVFLGAGITVAVVAGTIGWAAGGQFLESRYHLLAVPWLGDLKLSTVLLFDLGVYLVVVGLVVALLRSIGREEVRVL